MMILSKRWSTCHKNIDSLSTVSTTEHGDVTLKMGSHMWHNKKNAVHLEDGYVSTYVGQCVDGATIQQQLIG